VAMISTAMPSTARAGCAGRQRGAPDSQAVTLPCGKAPQSPDCSPGSLERIILAPSSERRRARPPTVG
jgi:hypothetical protein